MGFFSDLTGKTAARAAEEGARIQSSYGTQGINEQRAGFDDVSQMFAPYQQFGEDAIPLLQQLLNPQGQADFLNNNPLFQASLESVNDATLANQAARGRLGSGGTLEQLRTNFMATANPLIQQTIGNLFGATNTGMQATGAVGNARMGTANNISDLFTQIGNARAAGTVGAANARSQGAGNIFNTVAQLAGMAMTGGLSGLAGGAGSIGMPNSTTGFWQAPSMIAPR